MPDYADMALCAFCGSTLVRVRESGAMGEAGVTRLAPATAATASAGTPTASAAAPEEQVLRSVQCSQCAGPLSVREGRRILVCGHCGVRAMVRQHGGISAWPSR